MEISEKTVAVLKNFATINQSILVKCDKKELVTISGGNNILARAKIDEIFPEEFAIYDLNEFLNAMALFKEPIFVFKEKNFVIIKEKNGRSSCRYYFAEPSIIKSPKGLIKMPECEIKFSLSEENLSQIKKAHSNLQVPDLSVVHDGKDLIIKVHDKQTDSSNSYNIVVGEYDAPDDFSMDFQNENIKIMPDGYNIEISSRNVSHFSSMNLNVEYWIAVETSSHFG